MATILLDTSVIFDHLNGRYGRTEFLDQIIEQGHVLACCPALLLTDNRKHFPMPELQLLPLPPHGEAG